MGELDELPDAVELLRVQQRQPGPINQDPLRYGTPAPRPRPRPVEATSPQPQPQMPQAQAGPSPRQAPQMQDELPDAVDIMRGNPQREMPRVGSRLGTVRPAPDIATRMRDAVYGKQDPAYAGIPSALSAIDKQQGFSLSNEAGTLGRYALAASDKDLARMYAQQFGQDYVRTETDANGYPVIVYRDKTGQEAKAYVNKPGLDFEDVTRGVVGAIPFLKSAQAVNSLTKGAPLLGRAVVQGGGQGATSLAQDATGFMSGLTQPEPSDVLMKSGVAAAAGVGGEVVGSAANFAWRKLITEPKYYNRATGKLTPDGEAAARAAGIDPAEFTPQVAKDFAETFARNGNPEAAFRQAASNEAGIRRSLGELTGNREQLLREQQMRGGTYGTQAREAVENFDKLQRDDIVRATRGVTPPGSSNPSVAETLAPARRSQLATGSMGKTEAGENIAANTMQARDIARARNKENWDNVPLINATPEARDQLESYIVRATNDVIVDPIVDGFSLTPAAARMDAALKAFKEGRQPGQTSMAAQSTAQDVDAMRKRLLRMSQAAKDSEDKRAASAIYNGYVDWMTAAAEASGDITAAAASRVARQSHREMMEVFKGQPGSPASRIMADLMGKADTPERIVDTLFSGPGGQIKQGATTALDQLKRAYDKYLPAEEAKRAWDDVRLAYWLKMTADKSNDVKSPGTLATSIKTMLGDHKSLTRSLMTPEEISQMRRMAMALDEIKRKNPNSSWSGIAGGQLLRDFGNHMLTLIGWNSVAARTAAGTLAKPIQGAYGAAQSRKAFGGGQGAQLPTLPGPTFSGYGGAVGAQSQQ